MDFAGLLARVAGVPGVKRVRFTSPHPGDFTRSVFETMACEPALSPHIHLPVQSGSDPILERMRRGHTRSEFLRLVRTIREILPGVALTTDIIVGFPGETEGDFQQTLALMREVRFDSAFTFKYSPRPPHMPTSFIGQSWPEGEYGKLREIVMKVEPGGPPAFSLR